MEVLSGQAVPTLPARRQDVIPAVFCRWGGYFGPLYAPCDPSPRVAVSSSMAVIFAREMAQAVLVPVNLVEGRKLMG